jgi:hypothetical protein
MEASEMLDVIHYFFDQDMNYSTAEQAEAHSNMRSSVFREFYHTEYVYGINNSKNSEFGQSSYVSADFDLSSEEQVVPLDPFKKSQESVAKEVKPYVPATNFNNDSEKPFGSILDSPLG